MTEVEKLKQLLDQERNARKQAEKILKGKALELHKANESLQRLNESLEEQIDKRTKDLKASQTRYRNAIDKATDIIYSTDSDGYFTFINPTGSDAFGYSLAEIIGKRYIDFVPDEHKEHVFSHYTKVKNDNIANDYLEFPIRSNTGKIHWIGQNVNRIESANGSYYYIAVARDFTLRKNAEEELAKAQAALAQSEVKYRSVLENIELGVLEIDTKGVITSVYDRFCKMSGYSREELLGKDAIDMLLVDGFQHILEQQYEDRKNKKPGVYEVQLRRKDGKHFWVMISGAPFYNSEGQVIGSLGMHYDITDRKELEKSLKIARHKAIEAQKAEQQFLANMSHEIRTPLNAIIGMSHLLMDSPLDEKQTEYLDILTHSTDLLKGLVSDILDLSKIDAGMTEVNESEIEVHTFVQRLIKSFELNAQNKGLELKSVIPCTETCIVNTDKQWLSQILMNLISNALKFTADGEVVLTVRRIKNAETTSLFYFEVRDTGIGMTKEETDNIFTSFKQANTKIRTEYGGTGLGLSIASRLVSLLGGELEVESELAKGTRFYFSLNLNTTPVTDQAILQPPKGAYPLPTDKKIRILVAEDNLMNQKYISALLSKWKIPFDLAENGQQVVEHYKMRHYDLIFMDISMPIMNGIEATNIIRSLPGQRIPIIALTAFTLLSKNELVLQSDVTDFLAKPFTPEELSSMLQKHLLRKASTRPTKGKHTFSAVLDRAGLASLYGGDDVYALDMLRTYKNVIHKELEILETEIEIGAIDSIRQQVHKMKPMFSMVGLAEINKICLELEATLSTSSLDETRAVAGQIIRLANDSQGLIQAEIENLEYTLEMHPNAVKN